VGDGQSARVADGGCYGGARNRRNQLMGQLECGSVADIEERPPDVCLPPKADMFSTAPCVPTASLARSNQETDDGKDASPRLTQKAPYKGLCAESVEKHEPASDIAIAVVDSLKAVDPNRSIREADVIAYREFYSPRLGNYSC